MKLFSAALLVLSCSVWACNDEPKQGQPADDGTTGSLKISEHTLNTGVATAQPARIPSESEADSLLLLQQQIMQQPDDVALRRELGRRAIDVNAGMIWVVGKGRMNPKAATPSAAANQARMAATLDASRWAAYLIEWRKTDFATKFGAVQAQMPNVQVVREAFQDSLCIVLAQMPLK
ncbi:MAG: hypothetical protein ONB46_24845 [candidate division KSB1 bacterium]|nr:hypothetical protein [candidate division KSB1 bacterium]MDZ7369146.1 hypothetical protein [candidate division KSB1 bacterium]MDZ7407091.1 hypothetical protein [candidate division KSB1 bacterium]